MSHLADSHNFDASPLTQGLHLVVEIAHQVLNVYEGEVLLQRFSVSTALNGPGELQDSGCTPRGWHQIRALIGAGLPRGAVLVGRRPTGEVYTSELARQFPNRDWILSRILWLSGLEPGKNRGGSVDTMRRYIYIHGTPDTEPMGVAKSHGCVRMRNTDVICLFDMVTPGTPVLIR